MGEIEMDPAFIVMMHRIGHFRCSRYICAAVKRRRIFSHVFVNTFFIDYAAEAVFLILRCMGKAAWFLTGDFSRLALSEVNKTTLCHWRKAEEQQVVHSDDEEGAHGKRRQK